MLAEPTTSQPQPEKPQSWVSVLAMAFAVVLASGFVGLIGGGLLLFGLEAWLADPAAVQALLSMDGLSLCAHLFAVPAGIALLRRSVPRGQRGREYLGLKWPGLRQGLGWGLILLASSYGVDFLIWRLGIPFSERDDYQQIIRFPLLLPLTFLAIAVLGPIFEELLFRGFLVEGLRRSRLGTAGAILIPAAVWAAMHVDLPVRVAVLFLDGVLLALARLRTGSTYLTVLVHAIYNAVAVLLMANGA
ncbi:MAG TPA: CPBP family intramembrane glutamic endopeptidase [Thermoanaerobaculia bacterium]|jgi:membrane protease YdiL (CAAX protease family)|nr:CPBP family intramembrane glutamic endopeptidase [Thermoanaerobaculia bacterium]